MRKQTAYISDFEKLYNSKDNVNIIPTGNYVLIRTEVTIKTVTSKIIIPDAIKSKQDPNAPEGMIKIERFVHDISPDAEVMVEAGSRVEINTRQESIVSARLDIGVHTMDAYGLILDNMFNGADKILNDKYPTYKVMFYDLMPSNLIIGTYNN
jgi:hypothetical protein